MNIGCELSNSLFSLSEIHLLPLEQQPNCYNSITLVVTICRWKQMIQWLVISNTTFNVSLHCITAHILKFWGGFWYTHVTSNYRLNTRHGNGVLELECSEISTPYYFLPWLHVGCIHSGFF